MFQVLLTRYNKTFDARFMCCGEAPCKINVLPLQNLTYNDSYSALSDDSDVSEEFDDDSAEVSGDGSEEDFDKHLDIDEHFTDLANDFAKHFDSHSAVSVTSTFCSHHNG